MPTVELSQGRIHYTEDGEGPAVVLLHGVLVGGSLWRKVVAELNGVQGQAVDIGGYYHPDQAKTSQAMRPSATLNAALAQLKG